jgi:hypothetical protein
MTDRELIETNPSIHAARKRFHDWLDKTRPWAQPGCDVYQMMEQMADMAAAYFRGDCRPKQEDMEAVQADLVKVTALLCEHPVDYNGPCACKECQQG